MKVILFVVFLSVLQSSLLWPLLPGLVMVADTRAAGMNLATLVSCTALGDLITAPLLRSVDDKVGGRPLLAFAAAGTMLAAILPVFGGSMWLLALSRFVAGACGGALGPCLHWLADSLQDRQRGLVQVRAAVFAAFGLGPALAKHLEALGGYPAACAVSIAIGAIGIAVILCCLEQQDLVLPSAGHRASVCEPLAQSIAKLCDDWQAPRRTMPMAIWLACGACFLASVAMTALETLAPLFLYHTYFASDVTSATSCWCGLLSAVGLCGFLANLVCLVTPRCAAPFRYVLSGVGMLSTLGLAFASDLGSKFAFSLWTICLTFSVCAISSCSISVVTRATPMNAYPSAAALLCSACSLARILSPQVFAAVFTDIEGVWKVVTAITTSGLLLLGLGTCSTYVSLSAPSQAQGSTSDSVIVQECWYKHGSNSLQSLSSIATLGLHAAGRQRSRQRMTGHTASGTSLQGVEVLKVEPEQFFTPELPRGHTVEVFSTPPSTPEVSASARSASHWPLPLRRILRFWTFA